jgi:hypothetical protein
VQHVADDLFGVHGLGEVPGEVVEPLHAGMSLALRHESLVGDVGDAGDHHQQHTHQPVVAGGVQGNERDARVADRRHQPAAYRRGQCAPLAGIGGNGDNRGDETSRERVDDEDGSECGEPAPWVGGRRVAAQPRERRHGDTGLEREQRDVEQQLEPPLPAREREGGPPAEHPGGHER